MAYNLFDIFPKAGAPINAELISRTGQASKANLSRANISNEQKLNIHPLFSWWDCDSS